MSLMFVLLSCLAWGGSSLEGTWQLDPSASDSVAPLLALQGASWAARKAADAIVPQLEISVKGDTVTVKSTSPKGTTTEVFVADNTPHETASPDGSQATWVTHWQGPVLVSQRIVPIHRAQSTGTLTLVRRRVGDRLEQQVTLAVEDGTQLGVLRVFVPATP